MDLNNEEILDIAYAVTLSMPEGNRKEQILTKIEGQILRTGTTEENHSLAAIHNVPGREIGEDWFVDLEKHREFYWRNIPSI